MKEAIKRIMKWMLFGVPVNRVTAQISILAKGERLKGRKVLVTGGGRGLGLYIAKKCQEEGAEILISGRNEDTLRSASSQLSNCKYLVFDVQKIHEIPYFLDKANRAIGEIDTLVNNAGISLHEKSFFDVTTDGFDSQFITNIKAPYFLSQEFLRRNISKESSRQLNILFITSERGLYGDIRPYGLTKAAVNSLVEGLAMNYVNANVRVNAIAPGVTASDMTGFDKQGNLFRQTSRGKRVFIPEEVAETAVFLLSMESNCITGEIIPCNQGNHLRCDV